VEGGLDVRAWLESHDLGQYAEVFAANDIDAEVLRTLTAEYLKELGITSLGHRKKLLAAIAGTQTSARQQSFRSCILASRSVRQTPAGALKG
jgi:hypothetical protein